MTNDIAGTLSFLSQFNPPVTHSRLRTTSQLVPYKFCDYVGEVCFFRVEYGKAVMILTDYTEHPLLPFLEGDGRPSGQASIITTLWDEHCQTAQDINISVGDLLYLKNLRPKVDSDNKIELAMNGYRPGTQQLYRPTDPVQRLQQNDPLVKALLLRKTQYELHLIEQNTELAQQNIRPRNQEHGGASSQPQPTQSTRSQSVVPPRFAQPKPTQQSHAKPPAASIFPASSSSRAPPPVKLSTTPMVPAGSSSNTGNPALPGATRATPSPPQDIQPVPNVPLKREPTSPIAPTSSVIIFIEVSLKYRSSIIYTSIIFTGFNRHRELTNHRDGVSKFEYSFQLKLLDELGQALIVDVDNEHASTLIGTGAGNMLKNEALLKKVKDRLALIGVTTWDQEEKIIYFDCCVRQHIVRDSQEQPAGGGNKRSGSPIPAPGVKRLAKSAQETDEPRSQEPSSSQQSTITPMTMPGQAPSRLTWSLAFTEIN
ncbi:hypothetical protein BGW39_008672 [Mortierella sp. 14UC]|nr:hypothetical protein BGW39_008672 [Mortierella sp. 14UC]